MTDAIYDDERAVIGCAIYGAVTGIKMLSDDDYLEPKHVLIANAILGLVSKGVDVEPVTVCDELHKRGHLRQAGGDSHVSDLANAGRNYVGGNAAYFAEEVRNAARVRRLAGAAADLAAATDRDKTGSYVDELVSKFRTQLDAIPSELGGTSDDNGIEHQARTIRHSPEITDEWLIPGLLARSDRV